MSGGRPSVSAERALAHVDALIAQCPGLTQTHYARLAGLAHNGLVVARRAGRISVETEERILAVSARHVALSPPPQMPTSIASVHINALLAETGVTPNTIARAADVNYQTVYNVMNPKWPNVKWRIFAALMALTADDLRAETYWVDRAPTVTRIRALQANMWPLHTLGATHGMNLSGLANASLDSPMHAPTARRVQALYEAIGDEVGDSPRSATYARRLGYFPPIYYDEDMNLIEDVDDATRAEQERARTALCILGLTLEGRSVAQIVETLGCVDKDVSKARKTYGLAIGRTFDGGYEAVEARSGAVCAIRGAIKRVHYRSTLDALDEPGLDYVDLLASILDEEPDSVAA